MEFRKPIISQYLAAIEMLKRAILACPDPLWHDPADHNKFSQIAYHALFYIDLYLEESEQTFQRWPKHSDDYRLPPDEPPARPLQVASKELVLEYLAFCQGRVGEQVAKLDPEALSGFHWLPFNKFELQIYTIRHIQHHAAELMERLYSRAGIELDWVGIGAEATGVERSA